jgi:polar amino acid transport system substrate-binding protein
MRLNPHTHRAALPSRRDGKKPANRDANAGRTTPQCAMMRAMRKVSSVLSLLVVLGLAAATACAPADDTSSPSTPEAAAACTKGSPTTLAEGTLTFGTDEKVYEPWFFGDPYNRKGFESALAYDIAHELGYAKEDVKWVRVPFDAAIAPGQKTFDANINEFSINDDRRQNVDFSSPYFDVPQAVVTVKSSPAAKVKDLAGLKGLKLGALGTTTTHVAAKAYDPTAEVFNSNDEAKAALLKSDIAALVVDLPTAFYYVQDELTDGVIVGQLPPATDKPEQFGLVLQKNSPLTACVSKAVDELRRTRLPELQEKWLSEAGGAPVLS